MSTYDLVPRFRLPTLFGAMLFAALAAIAARPVVQRFSSTELALCCAAWSMVLVMAAAGFAGLAMLRQRSLELIGEIQHRLAGYSYLMPKLRGGDAWGFGLIFLAVGAGLAIGAGALAATAAGRINLANIPLFTFFVPLFVLASFSAACLAYGVSRLVWRQEILLGENGVLFGYGARPWADVTGHYANPADPQAMAMEIDGSLNRGGGFFAPEGEREELLQYISEQRLLGTEKNATKPLTQVGQEQGKTESERSKWDPSRDAFFLGLFLFGIGGGTRHSSSVILWLCGGSLVLYPWSLLTKGALLATRAMKHGKPRVRLGATIRKNFRARYVQASIGVCILLFGWSLFDFSRYIIMVSGVIFIASAIRPKQHLVEAELTLFDKGLRLNNSFAIWDQVQVVEPLGASGIACVLAFNGKEVALTVPTEAQRAVEELFREAMPTAIAQQS